MKLVNSRSSAVQSASVAATTPLEEVRFYRSNEKPWGPLSNLYRREITFEDKKYPSAEHAYQAGKARKEVVRKWILSAPTPSLVAMAAHGLYTWDIVPGWSTSKFKRMKQVLRAKFEQHADLCSILLATGNARIVESTTVDNPVNRTWGEVNGKGKNMLGVLLMEVREELRTEVPVKEKRPRSRRATGTSTPRPINLTRKKGSISHG